jgi:CBS domain-containing protein
MLLGAFTDGDLRRSLQRRGAQALSLPLSDVMTASPRTCCSDLKAIDAMQVLTRRYYPVNKHSFQCSYRNEESQPAAQSDVSCISTNCWPDA